jgi:hypothetical protein
MVRDHQPGEAVFRSILPEDIDWKPFPAFPPSARLAVLVGEPSQAGPYLIRVKVPLGVKLMPHRHPEDRDGLFLLLCQNASRTWLSSPSLVLGSQASAFCCKPVPAGLIPKPFSDQDVLREQENLTHPPLGASLANLELLGR